MRCGDNNEGWISFLGQGQIEGSLLIMGDFDFEGQRAQEQTGGQGGQMARQMRDEWDSYNEDAYERERVGRWH